MVKEINLHSFLKLLHWQLLHFGPFGIRAYQVLYSRRQFNTHLEITATLDTAMTKTYIIFSASFKQIQVNYALCIPSVFRTRKNHHIA